MVECFNIYIDGGSPFPPKLHKLHLRITLTAIGGKGSSDSEISEPIFVVLSVTGHLCTVDTATTTARRRNSILCRAGCLQHRPDYARRKADHLQQSRPPAAHARMKQLAEL